MEVRAMVPGDGPVLRAVRLSALADAPEAFESSLSVERELGSAHWERFAAVAGRVTFLAEREGEVVGTAGGVMHGEGQASASLLAMWVAPAERGAGTAHALAGAVARWAAAHGARTLGLCVIEDNVRAQAFYRSAGFVATGERRAVGDPPISEIVMRRPLP